MITNQNFVKLQNKLKIGVVIGAVLVVIGCVLVFLGSNTQGNNKKNAVYFNDILESSDKNKSGKYSYLEVYNDVYRFAQYGDNNDYCYFVYDDNYYYIVRMSEKDYEKYFKEDLDKVRIEGTVYETTDEIRNLAIDSFNESYGEDIVNLINFEDYFGSIYLNLNNKTGSNVFVYYLFGFMILIGGLVYLVLAIVKVLTFNKVMKGLTEMEKSYIDSELNSSNAYYYDNLKVILTPNYIVNFKGKFFILRYGDLIWMYPHDYYYNGFKCYQEIRFTTRNGKKYSMARSTGKKQILNYNSVWSYIINRNPNILLGFTAENQTRVNEFIKNNKM